MLSYFLPLAACGLLVAGCPPAGIDRRPQATGPEVKSAATRPTATATRPQTQPSTRPARTVIKETFDTGPEPDPKRWVVRNPSHQRVVVQQGALVVRGEARKEAARVELQIQEPLPALARWTLEFDGLVNTLFGGGRGEIRVELRDYANRTAPEGNDFVLAERYWEDESGLKFGIFQDGAFVGWHEVAPVGELGAWHHYRVEYESGLLRVWRDGKRALECDLMTLIERPLAEGLAIEMGFHVPKGSGIEGCIDNVTIVAQGE